jgi:signal transduction histidine kinase/CheY-like chemotaxis protein
MTTSNDCHHAKVAPFRINRIRNLARGYLLVLFACCYFLPTQGWASNRIIITEKYTDSQNFRQYLEFYDPGLQPSSLVDIAKLDEKKWHNIKEASHKAILNHNHTVWFRVLIDNKSREIQRLTLSNNSPLSEKTTIYVCPTDNEELCDRKDAEEVYINIPAETSRTVLTEITGFNSASPYLSLDSVDNFNQEQYYQKLYSGIVNGIILGLTLYTFLLAIKTRQAVYYSYTLLGACNLITVVIHQEVFSTYFHTISNVMEAKLSLLMPLFVAMAMIQFVREFLDTKERNKHIDRFLIVFIASDIVIAITFLLGTPPEILLPFFLAASCITTIIFFYLCLTQKKLPSVSVTFLAIGICIPTLSGTLTALLGSGLIAHELSYMQITQTLDAIEMMFFSLAVLSSVKQMEAEHIRLSATALEAQTISEAHNKLLAHLNHELRTPLNGILGAAEILVHKSHPRDRHIFSMICHTALPLKHLIDEMVDISAVIENKKNLQNSRFDLQNLLQECMEVFLPTATEKHIRLFFTVEHNIANDVTGDPNRLRQILLNLIGNACKFTTNGEVGLFVKMDSSLSENKCLYYFEVTDSGMGISKADEQRLFGIFETNNSKANPKGTGLGLSIVRELSELLGGSCGYASNVTNGSTFWFTAILEPHQKVHRKTHKAFEGLSILVADESASICNQLLHHVSCADNTVKINNSAEEIYNDIKSEKFDLVIVHKSLINDFIATAIRESGIFSIYYYDQNEQNKSSNIEASNYDYAIVRKMSTEAFSLQIADCIINKSNLIYKKEITKKHGVEKKKILAADDILSNQHIIKELIESLGYAAVICSNGKEAFNLYMQYLQEGNPFDAIIMDCEMPIQDGFDTTRQIRQYEKEHAAKSTPIIALTAHTESAYRLRSEQAGMNAYLTKPVTAERIMQCLMDAENI